MWQTKTDGDDMVIEKMSEIDKRNFPRIAVEPPVKISGGIEGKLVNISESGICISVPSPLLIKEYSLTINFPSQDVSIPVQIKWCKQSDIKDEILCGANIVNVTQNDLVVMRKYMVSKQFKYVVRGIQDRHKRREILVFAKKFRNYLFNLINLKEALKAGKVVKKELHEKIVALNHNIVTKGEELSLKIRDEQLMKEIKNVFRTLVSSWAYKSKIMFRGLEKPKGYPGDYETLEIIYDKRTFSCDNELGYYFDVYFLENPYAEAVRKRKDKLREIIEDIIDEKKSPIKVLNLACGACREIREICAKDNNLIARKDIFFCCLDWDNEALAFSKKELENAPKNFHINFIEKNVLSFIRQPKFYSEQGKQDLIYSIGLADYFTDRILKAMIKSSFFGLKQGGKFIIAHKDKNISFSHLPPEWFCDWIFHQRNQQDMLALIDDLHLKGTEITTDRDETGDIFFITLTKE